MSTDDDQRRLKRRHLLGAGAASLATLALPEGCYLSTDAPPTPSPGDAGGDGSAGDGAANDGGDGGDAGECGASCTQDANTLVVVLSAQPGLDRVGGSVLLEDKRYKDPFCAQDFVIIVQPKAGEFQAFSASCTHNCCTVAFVGTGFHCPCHQSNFDLTGKVTGGPAGAPLQQLATCTDGCNVYIQLK